MNWIGFVAIVSITSLLIVTLTQGIDGAILAGGIGVIGGIGGYLASKRKR